MLEEAGFKSAQSKSKTFRMGKRIAGTCVLAEK